MVLRFYGSHGALCYVLRCGTRAETTHRRPKQNSTTPLALPASSGVHFSFEKLDRVTCTTVCGKIDRVIEPKTYRNELVSFAIDEEMLQMAREHVSGSLESDDDGDGDQATAAAAAAALEAKAEAAAAARAGRFDALAAKREAGKARELHKKQQKRQSS